MVFLTFRLRALALRAGTLRGAAALWVAAVFLTGAVLLIGGGSAWADDPSRPASDDAMTAVPSSELKTLDGHFPFQVPQSREGWQTRSESLRRRVQVATGLWPMPARPPINPRIHGRFERDGVSVDKVAFESLPGHWVTGLLFRPAEGNRLGVVDGRRPGVLSPHGHGGRTYRATDKLIAEDLASGGEIYEASGRYPKLARCVHLARMGCVTFIFDMLGYADSQQISYEVAHRHKVRLEESLRDQPVFFGIDADLNLQSIMGLQTFNAIRALDFLESLDDVDPARLGVTGGSGGGTQTILLGALDDRVAASFPNGMVSTSMQGGCFCENCNYLRIDAGNVELAGLFAPGPQAMTAADDWTVDMMDDGYPELKALYKLFDAPENVFCRPLLQFKHNFNYVSRATMYPWMATHLGLGKDAPLVERDFVPLTESELAVWTADHPAPKQSGVDHERAVLRWWRDQSEHALAKAVAIDDSADWLDRYRQSHGTAWRVIFDARLPKPEDLVITDSSIAGGTVQRQWVEHPPTQTKVVIDSIGALPSEGESVVLLSVASGSYLSADELRARADQWTDRKGRQVIAVYVEPALDDGSPRSTQAVIDDPRPSSAFTYGYNRTLAVRRAQQILDAIAWVGQSDVEIELVVDRPSLVAGAVAGVIAGPSVGQLTLDTGGFRLGQVNDYRDADFVPGASKYGDLPGWLTLRAPHRLTVHEQSPDDWQLVTHAYRSLGQADAFHVRPATVSVSD